MYKVSVIVKKVHDVTDEHEAIDGFSSVIEGHGYRYFGKENGVCFYEKTIAFSNLSTALAFLKGEIAFIKDNPVRLISATYHSFNICEIG